MDFKFANRLQSATLRGLPGSWPLAGVTGVQRREQTVAGANQSKGNEQHGDIVSSCAAWLVREEECKRGSVHACYQGGDPGLEQHGRVFIAAREGYQRIEGRSARGEAGDVW